MYDEVPINVKNIFLLILYLLFAVGFQFLILNVIKELNDEQIGATVESKHIKKGLYLYPRFEVYVEGFESPMKISKEEYDDLSIGDKVYGSVRNEDKLMTATEIKFELMIGIPILLLLYIVVILWSSSMLNSSSFIKRQKRLHRFIMKTRKHATFVLFFLYLFAGAIMIILVGINAFNKVNKMNLTKTEAIVLGSDWDHIRSPKGGSYSTYELFLKYKDNKGESHITQKAVTSTTYDLYDQFDKVTLYYRNNNIYDTFIQTKSMKEYVFAFINLITIILALYLFSIIFIIYRRRKKRFAKQEEQENKIVI